MNKKTYSEQLKSPKWQMRRLKVMERDGAACQMCGSKENTLNVHHIIYERGIERGEEKDENLITLCEGCHADVESLKEQVQRAVFQYRPGNARVFYGHLLRLFDVCLGDPEIAMQLMDVALSERTSSLVYQLGDVVDNALLDGLSDGKKSHNGKA